MRAHDDEISAHSILKNKDGSPNTVCFLTQQMAEKLLKSFLIFNRHKFPKIHHLDRLINLCSEINPRFEQIRNEAEELSEFYISTRYPGDYPQFNFQQAEKAFQKALRIKKIALDFVKD